MVVPYLHCSYFSGSCMDVLNLVPLLMCIASYLSRLLQFLLDYFFLPDFFLLLQLLCLTYIFKVPLVYLCARSIYMQGLFCPG